MCPRRFPLFALSLFLALLLFPSRALAYDFIPKGLVYSADLDGSRFGAVAVAANQFDAACYALGKEPASISTSIRSKLSDPNYGGRFYEFSQAFYTQGWPLEDVPQWLPAYVWGSVELSDLLLSDYQSVWYVTCTQSLRSGALVDFLAVLNGEDLGGGGSGGVVDGIPAGDYYELTLSSNYYPLPSSYHPHVVYLSVDLYNMWLNDSHTAGRNLYFFARGGNGVSNPGTYVSVGFWWCRSMWADGGTYRPLRWTGGVENYWTDDVVRKYVNDGLFCYSYPNTDRFSHWESLPDSTSSSHKYGTAYMIYKFDPSDWPIVHYGNPDGDWPGPETPVAPTAPDLPEPVTPTVTPEPTVTEPTPTWPVIPTPTAPTVTLTDTPSGLDYTQLLTLINDNLNDINSYTVAINSNFNSLRSDLVTEFDSVVQALRNIYQYLQHLDNLLERHCVHLQNKMEDVSVDIQNKMRELVHWLAEQLDFDSDSSGNSDLFGILSTINDKLGGGTYEPNPLKSEDSYYEWLDDLWDRFLLGDDWQSSVSGISSSFGQLKTRFPFSVPWDIVALFRLFVHEPVTPEFDLPLYFSPDSSTPVHVDLSAWDDVASIVRPLVYVIFALKLALLSRDLLGGLGADKGGL